MWPGVQGKSGIGMYNQFEKERDQGNFELLPELHAILSGMKVLFPFLCTLQLLETAQMSYSHKITVITGMIARTMDCSLQPAGADHEQMMVFPCLLDCPLSELWSTVTSLVFLNLLCEVIHSLRRRSAHGSHVTALRPAGGAVEGTATACCLACPPCTPHMYRTPPGRATTMSCASR